MRASPTREEVARFILERDERFADVVERVGPPPARRGARVDQRFAALTRTITFQLLATKAARTIHERVIACCELEVTPSSILRAGHDQLRAVGLSNAKAAAMIELARRTQLGHVQFERHGRLRDELVQSEVTAVRGLGPWSAQMYLMNALARPDVWPVGDYGVRAGWSRLHQLPEIIDERSLRLAGERFAGQRSALAWYCWRALEST